MTYKTQQKHNDRGPGWFLLLLAIACIFGFLWFWNWLPQPYEKPTPIPVRIINAALARHGNVKLITATSGLYFERGGQKIWVVKR